jgi:hypothetical protein
MGIKGGRRLGYDFESKSLLDKSYTYKTAIEKYTVLGKKTLFPDYSDTETNIILEGDDDPTILLNMNNDDFIKRYSKQMALIINVEGHERRYAGMMIDVIWPSIKKEHYFNKGMEGLFLVKSITHQFSSRSTPPYRQKMVLLKTGYTDSDSGLLMKSEKTNISTVQKRK